MPVISTNNAGNAALNYLNQNSAHETGLLAKLASGSRIVQASDDAAGLAIGTQLQASVAVYKQDAVNVQQGSSILQAADGAFAQISNILQRMQALATQSASGQVTDVQRTQDIAVEYGQLYSEIGNIVSTTRYAGTALLNAAAGAGLNNVNYQVGTLSGDTINITVATITDASTLGLNVADTNNASCAAAAINLINTAIGTINSDRAKVGAYESQFNFADADIATNIQNTSAAASVIMDADVAAVKSQLSSTDVKTQASVA